MATPAEIEQRLAAARAALGPLEANQGAVLREIGVLSAEKAALRAASQKLYQGGDQVGAKLLREQEGALDNKIYELSQGPAAQALEAEQARIRTLENDLSAAQQKAEFDAKQTAPTATAEVKDSANGATQNPAPISATVNERLTTTQAAALTANTDFMLGVHRPDPEKFTAKLSTSKQKDGEKMSDLYFDMERVELADDDQGYAVSSLVSKFHDAVSAVLQHAFHNRISAFSMVVDFFFSDLPEHGHRSLEAA
jgi:hypothetical protein